MHAAIGSLLFITQSKRFIATINVSMEGKTSYHNFALNLHVFLN